MKTKIVIFSLCLLFIVSYFMLSDLNINNQHDIENKIAFLTQQKEIIQKDFDTILELIQKQNKLKNAKIQDRTHNREDIKIHIPTLHAIVNEMVLLDNKWLKVYETIQINDNIFTIIEITHNWVKIKNEANQDILQLDIFPISKNITFESY